MPQQTREEKIEHLLAELHKYEEKLAHLYKHYRGVIHESAQSEMTHTNVKVFESHVQSIKDELKTLGVEIKD